ncbi:sulfotransferase [Prochlorothrix hollandica]
MASASGLGLSSLGIWGEIARVGLWPGVVTCPEAAVVDHCPLAHFSTSMVISSNPPVQTPTPGSYALVVGNGRSGTNWLLSMLAASPQTHCRNEPHDIASSPFHRLPSASEIRQDPDLMADRWRQFVLWTTTHMGERDHRITAPKTYVHPLSQKLGVAYFPVRPKIRRALMLVLPALRQAEWLMPWWIGSQSRLGQATGVLKINDLRAWIVRWVLETQPQVPVLHIVRHPGGQLQSGMSRFFSGLTAAQRESETQLYRGILKTAIQVDPHWREVLGDESHLDRLDLMEAVAWFWRYNNEEIYTLGQQYPNYHLVVYEQLALAPLDYARQVYDACGLAYTPAVEAHINAGTRQSVWGKLSQSSAEVAQSWKKKLSLEYQALAQQVLEGSVMAPWWSDGPG